MLRGCKVDSKDGIEWIPSDKDERPFVTVDVLIFTVMDEEVEDIRKMSEKKLNILLVSRRNEPFKGKWAVPGGFVKIDESLENAAYRVLKEETGIDGKKHKVYIEQLYTFGETNRDPRARVISASYIALVDAKKLKLDSAADQGMVKWFWVKDLPQLAFDHKQMIEYGINRLKNKIEYTDIAFNLLPNEFTLTEVQRVYEAILDRPLYKANFRREIEGVKKLVVPTGHVKTDVGYRPPKLYKFNPDYNKSAF